MLRSGAPFPPTHAPFSTTRSSFDTHQLGAAKIENLSANDIAAAMTRAAGTTAPLMRRAVPQ